VDEIEGLHRKLLSSVRVDEKSAAEVRLKQLVDENKQLSRRIQGSILQNSVSAERRIFILEQHI
jgi:hypothetical protein